MNAEICHNFAESERQTNVECGALFRAEKRPAGNAQSNALRSVVRKLRSAIPRCHCGYAGVGKGTFSKSGQTFPFGARLVTVLPFQLIV